MCGIIISTLNIPNEAHKFNKNRGPDHTNIVNINNINFIHFLLHLTGKKTLQPINQDNIVIIFNGEIYNYKELNSESESDIHSIMYVYKKYGEDFVKYLDGEFTIVLFDFNKDLLFISSDIFKTKPLFYNISNEDITIASYRSSCNKIKKRKYIEIQPNEVLIFNLKNRNLIKKYKIYNFDLNQHKSNYDDYIKAFEKSILKRYPENSIPLITLSSGLDSGAIACCLNKYKKKALYITIPKNENYNIINKRKEILKDNYKIINLTINEKNKWKKYLIDNCEYFEWNWMNNPRVRRIENGFKMGSMLGKAKIITETKKIDKNIRVLFSGIGADEVLARNQFYSCGWGNVNVFPEKLEKVFPWENFYKGSMENYLKGDEYLGGCFGFETRYPFVDKDLVQEFLWLKPELKNSFQNSIVKPPLAYYLHKNKFPYHLRKLGFNV